MPKPVISFLLVIGFLFFLMGIIFSKFLVILGIIMMAVALLVGLSPGGILRKDHVEESWGVLIEKAQGKAEEVFQNADAYIKENNVPSITMEHKSIAPGIVRGYLGKVRDFLVVTDSQNVRIKPYKIFLNVRDYGNNLDISWYMTFKPTLWQAALNLIPFVNVIQKTLIDLDLFDQQDLRAYATVVHHAVQKSVDKLMFDLNQDPSKIERKSRGFLGIS
jgi:type IV secretory pathway TrbF-like protein